MIKAERQDRVRQLLEEQGTVSVKEISAKLGFTDTDKFVKYFKYHENISPARYRNTYTNTHINKK